MLAIFDQKRLKHGCVYLLQISTFFGILNLDGIIRCDFDEITVICIKVKNPKLLRNSCLHWYLLNLILNCGVSNRL